MVRNASRTQLAAEYGPVGVVQLGTAKRVQLPGCCSGGSMLGPGGGVDASLENREIRQ